MPGWRRPLARTPTARATRCDALSTSMTPGMSRNRNPDGPNGRPNGAQSSQTRSLPQARAASRSNWSTGDLATRQTDAGARWSVRVSWHKQRADEALGIEAVHGPVLVHVGVV